MKRYEIENLWRGARSKWSLEIPTACSAQLLLAQIRRTKTRGVVLALLQFADAGLFLPNIHQRFLEHRGAMIRTVLASPLDVCLAGALRCCQNRGSLRIVASTRLHLLVVSGACSARALLGGSIALFPLNGGQRLQLEAHAVVHERQRSSFFLLLHRYVTHEHGQHQRIRASWRGWQAQSFSRRQESVAALVCKSRASFSRATTSSNTSPPR
mmetsp:Transcript_92255/g.160238  ORF Transcript_92255/g.160238 Transcript_92255/m.160238 type:complete len:212 (-) Transcript_92255:2104-2739(-)